jgi:hypothetical protein
MPVSEGVASADKLNTTITAFLAQDDVFSAPFLKTLVLGGPGVLSEDATQHLESVGCETILTAADAGLMPGHTFYIHPAQSRRHIGYTGITTLLSSNQ